MLNEVRGRLTDRHVEFEVTAEAREALVKEGFDPVYGARPLRRTVTRRIENPLAKRILAGEFTDGDVVRVDHRDAEYTFERAAHHEAAREPEAAGVA
jgi:ATP-dependent Clp protease ATP-binding subunit ClpA